MKLLLINQPLNNRGDESAHKALVRTIIKEIPEVELTVLFWGNQGKMEDTIRQFAIQSPNVKYHIYYPLVGKGMHFIMKLGQKTGLHFLWFMHLDLVRYIKKFKKVDMVVCAPGGMCMGGFQNWEHIFNLQCAKHYNKPLAYYGRSLGPFPTITKENRIFKKISLEMLNYLSFLSVRDNKSFMLVKELGINNCVNVVDTAFLETPSKIIPHEILQAIGDNDYFVFVPNLLIWHPYYKGKVTKGELINFYVEVLYKVSNVFPHYKVVMLPQTFNYTNDDDNDINLFKEIAENAHDNRIVVIDDVYSSDIQQSIISRSKFVIGSRYHSIIFALNNNVPFVSLSYEHKMEGLLQTLGKTNSMISINESIVTAEGRRDIINKIQNIITSIVSDEKAVIKAKKMTYMGFLEFKNSVMSLYVK